MLTLLLLAAVQAGPTADPVNIPVVLTTDCGTVVDDQWALAHLAVSDRIELRAVITTHAPNLKEPAAETSAEAARQLLAKLRLKRVPPVVPGSSVKLADRSKPLANPGVDRLLAATRDGTPDQPVTVLVIGAATDVASALLTDPSFARRVRVVAMGFDSWPKGLDPWNVRNDVKAWQVLLDSSAPLVIGATDVCRKDLLMTSDEAHKRFDPCGEGGAALAKIADAWFAAHGELAKRESGSAGAWPIWDEVTVAHLLGLTEEDEKPRPALRDDLTFDLSNPKGRIGWVRSVRSDALWADLAARLKSAQADE